MQLDTSGVDLDKVVKATETKKRKVLFGTGAYGAKAVNGTIRKAGKQGGRAHVSKPGTPPKYHVKPGLKGNFYFNVNLKASAVQIGPGVQMNGGSKKIKVHAASGAEMLEMGGSFTVLKTKKRAHVKPRPFMAPALEKKIKPIFLRNIQRIPLK
tara:strand:+ start:378 stop:839 length:462 start_codon:yes stop_codon:yes gene_type:complete